ncbi:hypothetical protein AKJ09_08069 [Labilithrix luteola]|uniref:Uncharacterized protein n=1 Tax=Labilithrix luteola TaxID=1391654 RepID=A0A0K1Q6E3_9BACT|nr:hypothetical protein AKJ09_08069 [Labilithrix luteola]
MGSQIGAARPQSSLARHFTHLPVATWHRGEFWEQSLSVVHSTHCFFVGEHTPEVQSAVATQPTHAPFPSSHVVPAGQSDGAWQAGWQS